MKMVGIHKYNMEDIDDFCQRIRNFVFDRIRHTIAKMLNIDVNSLDDADKYISQKETIMIFNDVVENFDGKISQKKIVKICEDINKRIFSNILNKMSIDGDLDCAWSEADQSFVFKVSQEGQKKGLSIPKIFEK